MNRNQAKEMLPIIHAFAEGKGVETKTGSGWVSIENMSFAGNPNIYRIKPEPRYRPFANAEECWNEMEKHQPFGWLDNKKDRSHSLITHIKTAKEGIYINGIGNYFFNEIMEKFTFADGTPFGIKLEE